MNCSKNLHRIPDKILHLLYWSALHLCFASPCHTADSLHIWLSHEVHHMIGLQKVFVFFQLNETKPWPDEFWKTWFTIIQITDSIKANVNWLKCMETPKIYFLLKLIISSKLQMKERCHLKVLTMIHQSCRAKLQ